ncbi:hypothetical protein [Phytohabitans rumicis]|uniref:Uncharacterized protein n=1 Tax=Phytohabitans rumicis TaxID=1076125 RepID=A0A6V8LAL3_9ACTN|nr:hypothetical protein [Phytohabitans rumicis]GFJ92068.1 hypothetical protein Prum_057100 [Phytohabitans rumicis]
MRYTGICLGHETDREAEHWLHALGLPPGVEACTHLVRTPYPQVAISLALPDGYEPDLPAAGSEAADQVAAAHRERRSGRAVLFAGVEALTGTVTVADMLANSAIDRVIVLGGAPADPAREVVTRDFVRPQWMDGALTLITAPAPAGRLAPFEYPNPTPCCAPTP